MFERPYLFVRITSPICSYRLWKRNIFHVGQEGLTFQPTRFGCFLRAWGGGYGRALVLGGGMDSFFNQEGVNAAYKQINQSFSKGGFDDRLYIQEHDTGHIFNRQMQETAWSFLKKHLMDLT